ncbi:MAG: anthranilate synthase component I [Gemmataceae bacterium]
MGYQPDFEDFARLAAEHTCVPVYRRLMADSLTPVSAFRALHPGEWGFLFESVIGGERIGRYSFLGTRPFMTCQAYGHRVEVQYWQDEIPAATQALEHADPLKLLEELITRYRAPHLTGLPRFTGGAVGYAAYDAVRYTERLPAPPPDDRHLPDLSFGFYDAMIIFDHIFKTVYVVAQAHAKDKSDLRAAYRQACARVDRLVEQLERSPSDLAPIDVPAAVDCADGSRLWRSNFPRERFLAAVEKCKEYIRAGDIFQVVISQRLERESQARPFDIYRTLRIVNPSPFMFFLRHGDLYLVGASPEIMVRVEGDLVTIRPLAGTRRRGRTEEEDRLLERELLADPKERAEHIMLVDLGRNDIGRIARFGTVQVSDVMVVERYSHVMHITSNVTGRLRPECNAFDALRACLPAGTVTGAPKVRAMEIIDELEPHRRGPYAGAVGYIDFSGNMDTCIALRTLVMKGNQCHLQAGAGIVYDSIPEREYEETLNKARGLMRAIELAENLTPIARASQASIGVH